MLEERKKLAEELASGRGVVHPALRRFMWHWTAVKQETPVLRVTLGMRASICHGNGIIAIFGPSRYPS